MGAVSSLVAAQTDPRRAEVYAHLGEVLNGMTIADDANEKLLKEALQKVVVANGGDAAASIFAKALDSDGR